MKIREKEVFKEVKNKMKFKSKEKNFEYKRIRQKDEFSMMS